MYNFVFNNPTKIYFGNNQLIHLAKEIKKYGSNILLCYGGGSIKRIGLYQEIIKILKNNNINFWELDGIEPNPRVSSVEKGSQLCKENNIDLVLAVGGGSVIDCSKFICTSAFYDGNPWDLVTGKSKISKALPLITVLTLSATGSEMNCGAVISNLDSNDKIGMGSPLLYPKSSFLIPKNTYTVSRYQTACGSADIMAHIIETYFNTNNSMFMLDSIMESLMKTVIKFTPIAMEKPDDEEARSNLMWASSWAINGFIRSCQNCTWSCHSIEHQLSAYYDITHGLGLAIVIPRWLEFVFDTTNQDVIERFYRFGTEVFEIDKTLDKIEVGKLAIDRLKEFFYSTLELTDSLSKLNIDDRYFSIMAEKACKGEKTLNGYKTLDKNDIETIYKTCI